MKRLCCLLAIISLLTNCGYHDRKGFFVKDVANPLQSLNGQWEICFAPYDSILNIKPGTIKWESIMVPGECMMQSFPIKHNKPFIYRKEFKIPSDYKGKLIKILFEGVYSYARVWVNGKYIRDHSGGFTAWECDISSAAKPGKKATMIVEITDRPDEISYASGYAKHQIGGILRSVNLLALPENYPKDISVTTDFDENYRNATLLVEGLTCKNSVGNTIELELWDSNNHKVELQSNSIAVSGSTFKISNQILNPIKWDAEHPNLYQLKISFTNNGKMIWRKNYPIGFREIEVRGNRFLINGCQVKLRGVCRHDIHPMLGRISTPDYALKDVLLAREANVNFIRTSHYPPSEKFLEYCDKYGIYIEDETAVCFVGSHRTAEYYPGSSENSPDFTERYLSQLNEMVSNHRNHPSVIIWSIGNENAFGFNFKKSYDWIKNTDTTRPVIFSYPGLVPDSLKSYDILSMHYPGTDGDMNQYGKITASFGYEKIPVIFDEWAHVACYNSETVSEDPNIRDFWGISLDSMWQRTFESDGGLGGSIWGMIDETFMIPADLPGYNKWWGKLDKNVIPGKFAGHTIGYGEWGIIDTWRRKKPEFWNVKKAYSPIRILRTENYEISSGKQLKIPVYNRFDFTNLNEVDLKLRLKGKTNKFSGPDIPPHQKGNIIVNLDEWPAGESIYLEFIDRSGNMIDSYILSGKPEIVTEVSPEYKGTINLGEEGNDYVIICSDNLKIRIDRSTGLFTTYEYSDGKISFSGPCLNLRALGKAVTYSSHKINDLCTEWRLDSLSAEKKGNIITVSSAGKYSQNIEVKFTTDIYPDGTIKSEYVANNIPEGLIREAGVRYILENDFDSLIWKRKSYWSSYPDDHLSCQEGKVPLFTNNNRIYRETPHKEWQYDKKSFFYDGIENETDDQLINIARSTKENIFSYTLARKGNGSITVYGYGDKSCRIEKTDNHIVLNISNEVDYPDLSWGNYSRNIRLKESYSGKSIIAIR